MATAITLLAMERMMHWQARTFRNLVISTTLLASISVAAAGESSRAQDEQAIRAAAKSYLAALAKGDSKALAEFWTADGEFIDDQGNHHSASELAAEAQPTFGRGLQPKAKITASKIRFLSDDVAIEDGSSDLQFSDGKGEPPVRGHFHAAWVKQDGRWRLSSLYEAPIATAAEPRLSELAWMIGDWTANCDGVRLEVNVQWNATGTYLLRNVKVIDDGKVILRGSQRIGRDPLTRNLKSWSFDSDGGYDEATWSKEGDSWIGKTTGVLPDGRQSSSTTIITFDGQNSYARQVLAGRIQGEPIADQLVRFTRLPGSSR
jgi:uncharacterized protein (TIGR02246 family)